MKPITKKITSGNGTTEYFKMVTDEKGDVIVYDVGYINHIGKSGQLLSLYNKYNAVLRSHSRKHEGMCYFWYRHRIGRPAINHNGKLWWYIRGIKITDTKEYCELCGFSDIKTMQWLLKYGDELPSDLNF